MVGGEHQLMPHERPDGAEFIPAAGGGVGCFLSHADRSETFESADHVEILHDRPVRVSAEVLEDPAAHEKPLVTVGRA